MAKVKTVKSPPSREDVATFLAVVDHDTILAAMAPKHHQGLVLPDDAAASKRVYEWLRAYADGKMEEWYEGD